MRENWDTVLLGWQGSVVLVPYRQRYVSRYHSWMQDDELLEQTASERLSLEEERANCDSWRDDERKLTFIILARADCDASFPESAMAGDVNVFFHHDDGAEVEVMIAEAKYRRRGFGSEAVRLALGYACKVRQPRRFYAKIGAANVASQKLFESLGFSRVAFVEAFQEHEFEAPRHEFELEATPAQYDVGGPTLIEHATSITLGDDKFLVRVLYYGAKAAFVWVGSAANPPVLDALALAGPALFECGQPAATSLLGHAGLTVAQRLSKSSKRLVLVSWTVDDDVVPIDAAVPMHAKMPALERLVAARLLPFGFRPCELTPSSEDQTA